MTFPRGWVFVRWFSREVNFQVFTRSDISSEQDQGLLPLSQGSLLAAWSPSGGLDTPAALCWWGWCCPKLVCEKCSCCRGTVIGASHGGLFWVGPVLDLALLSTSSGGFWWLVSAKLPSWAFQVPWAQRRQIVNFKTSPYCSDTSLNRTGAAVTLLSLCNAGQGCGSPGVCLQLQLLHLQNQVGTFGTWGKHSWEKFRAARGGAGSPGQSTPHSRLGAINSASPGPQPRVGLMKWRGSKCLSCFSSVFPPSSDSQIKLALCRMLQFNCLCLQLQPHFRGVLLMNIWFFYLLLQVFIVAF